MGKQDLLAKKYMSDNEKFADVFNYYLYNGKQVIKPENLHEESISEIALPYSEKNKNTFIEKYRDIIKRCVVKSDNHYTYFLLGIENQSEVHYAMPVKQYEKNKEEVDMCKAIEDMILEGKQEGIQEGIKALIEVAKELGATTDIIEKKVEEKFNLSKDEAVQAVNKYYN